MANNKYDYEEDYFLNGNATFNKYFDSLTKDYETYVTGTPETRAQIDEYFSKNANMPLVFTGVRGQYAPLQGFRGYLRDIGTNMNVDHFDTKIAAFNPKNAERSPELAKEQQDAIYRSTLEGYLKCGDKTKELLFTNQQAHHDVVKDIAGDEQTRKFETDYGFDFSDVREKRRQDRLRQANALVESVGLQTDGSLSL